MVCQGNFYVVKPLPAVLQPSICRAYLQAAGECMHGQTRGQEDSGGVTDCASMQPVVCPEAFAINPLCCKHEQ